MKYKREIGKDTLINDLTILEDLDNEDYIEEPDLRGPKYLECTDLFGNTWYKNLWTGEDLPVGAVPLDLYDYE